MTQPSNRGTESGAAGKPVVIVGAGLAGLTCAVSLSRRSDVPVIVLEAVLVLSFVGALVLTIVAIVAVVVIVRAAIAIFKTVFVSIHEHHF